MSATNPVSPIQVATAIPDLTIPMIHIAHPQGGYDVAMYVASNDDWARTARHVISQSGTGEAFAAVQRTLNGDYSVRQLGSMKDLADLIGGDNLPKSWDGQTLERGAVAIFRWIPEMGYEEFDRPKQPVNVSWYQAQGLALTLGRGIRLLSDGEWEYAAQGGARKLDFATATGELLDSMGNALAHCSIVKTQRVTIDVDDQKNSITPDGIVGMTGNVGEWTCEKLPVELKYGFRGSSYLGDDSLTLRVDSRDFFSSPAIRDDDFGVRFGR